MQSDQIPSYHTNVFARPDTLLGVCEAIGEDFRFNANWLRVAFALPMFAFPTITIAVYLALGLVVMATRLALPNPHVAAPVDAAATADEAELAEEQRELAMAA